MMHLLIGAEQKKTIIVTNEQTDEAWGGSFHVLSSPALIGSVEMLCAELICDQLEAKETTVGVKFDFLHLAPTPTGRAIEIIVKLVEADEKMLTFSAEVKDTKNNTVVFKGFHKRAVVQRELFIQKILNT
ncbi:hypothetical protein J3P96_15975 [Pseudomonas sp. R3-56]|uniref:thioesterase family protein n=1 Tax=Pseudomonas sp. R3-56 TaxID=2817401 RepID=UPI003DAA2443